MCAEAARNPHQPGLTRGQTSRALRAFIWASAIWGAWGQAVGIGTAVFTGFALQLGADGSFIALFTSIAYFAALFQLFSPLISRKLRDRKRFILCAGFLEILFRSLIVLIPIAVMPALHLPALVTLVALGLVCGYALSPFYSTWVADTIPEPIRARFTSQQTIVSTLVAMAAGFVIGKFIDVYPDRYGAFLWVFGFGAVSGWSGYAILSRAPFAPEANAGVGSRDESLEAVGALFRPLRDPSFRRAVLFYGLWTFATGVAGPLYSVFMLEELGISYTTISVYNAVFMVTSIGAYRLWAPLVDRFGSKAVLQLLIVPAGVTAALWVFNRPGVAYLVPVAMLLSGIVLPGIGVAVTPLLYGLLPEGRQRTIYIASWSAGVNLMGALGPLTGALLVRLLRGLQPEFFGFALGHLQIIFAISAVTRVLPVLILRGVNDHRGVSSRHLLSQMLRGNLFTYAFNAVVYSMAAAEDTRAKAAYGLGRSGNPLAIDQLIHALKDASPVVRSSAARALGETRSPLATESLVRELADGSSDIRSEAAEALGRLGDSSGIDPLLDALDDADPRVRISAIRGLASIDREEVRELLFWHFSGTVDPVAFPTLVDVLGEAGDQRIIKRTLEQLAAFASQAIRLQLLDSVCQALGAQGQFYRLLSYEETRRTSEVARMLKRAASRLAKATSLDAQARAELQRPCERLIQAYDNDNMDWVAESVRQITGIVRDGLAPAGQPPYEVLNVFIVILAINTFMDSPVRHEMTVAEEIFIAVCLLRLAEAVRKVDAQLPD